MKQRLPTYCDQCYNGSDLLNAVVEDGIVHSLEPNANCATISPGKGKICVKAYGLIQKLYNPDRIQTPLIRTNPRKGRDEDPGWIAISWDEALELLAGKMRRIRERGVPFDPWRNPHLLFAAQVVLCGPLCSSLG